MHYVLLYQVVDDFTETRMPFRADHLLHISAARDRGELIMAGPLTDPVDTAMLVFQSDTPQAAEQFAHTDPYVTGGLVKSWQVRKWMTVVGPGSVMPDLPKQ